MIVHVVVVFDTAAQSYGRPFFVNAVAQALRSFGDEVNSADKKSDLSRHPEDFELYSLGSFDDQSGRLSVTDPQFLVRAKDLVSLKE